MNGQQIYRNRAIIAFWLTGNAKAKLEEVQQILRAKSKWEVRKLVARGARLNRELEAHQ